jgi:hypothetical protein
MTPKNKYFKVTAKCGHVGKGNYVPVAFAVKAESRSAASQKVMTYHRVKKQLNDAIISCEEIDRDSYKELVQANKEFKYLQCKCNRQQREIEGFDSLICKNEYREERHKVEPAKSMKYRRAIYELGGRRSSLSLCYGED